MNELSSYSRLTSRDRVLKAYPEGMQKMWRNRFVMRIGLSRELCFTIAGTLDKSVSFSKS